MAKEKQIAIEQLQQAELMGQLQRHLESLDPILLSADRALMEAEAGLEWTRLRGQEIKHEQELVSQEQKLRKEQFEVAQAAYQRISKRKLMLQDLDDFFHQQRFMGNGALGRFYSQSLVDFCDERKKGTLEVQALVEKASGFGRIQLDKQWYAFLVGASNQVYFHPGGLEDDFFEDVVGV